MKCVAFCILSSLNVRVVFTCRWAVCYWWSSFVCMQLLLRRLMHLSSLIRFLSFSYLLIV